MALAPFGLARMSCSPLHLFRSTAPITIGAGLDRGASTVIVHFRFRGHPFWCGLHIIWFPYLWCLLFCWILWDFIRAQCLETFSCIIYISGIFPLSSACKTFVYYSDHLSFSIWHSYYHSCIVYFIYSLVVSVRWVINTSKDVLITC